MQPYNFAFFKAAVVMLGHGVSFTCLRAMLSKMVETDELGNGILF